MMPDGLLVQFELYQPDGIVLATRLFVLSYTLAIKWLSDEAYLLQHWYVSQAYNQRSKLISFQGSTLPEGILDFFCQGTRQGGVGIV
jgi:hypothetical protein